MAGSSLTQRAHGTVEERVHEGPTLKDQIQSMQAQFALAMPKGMEAAQLVRDALTAIRTTPKLAECSPESVLGALMTCAQLGLRPGVLGQAWVLPYWDNKSRRNVAQLVVGYKGIVDLAYRSGQIATIIARTVYEGDTWDVEYGLEDKLIHKPAYTGERKVPIAHYAIVKLANGGKSFWVMTEDEMQAWKRKHAPKNRAGDTVGPWVTNYEPMARKTVLLRLAAFMPKSTEFAYAMEIDNGVRTNIQPTATPDTVTHHYAEQVHDLNGDTYQGAGGSDDGAQAPSPERRGTPEAPPAPAPSPAPETKPVTEPEQPAKSTPSQRKIVTSLLSGLGVADSDTEETLLILSKLVSRALNDITDLTRNETQHVGDLLRQCTTRADLNKMLDDIDEQQS